MSELDEEDFSFVERGDFSSSSLNSDFSDSFEENITPSPISTVNQLELHPISRRQDPLRNITSINSEGSVSGCSSLTSEGADHLNQIQTLRGASKSKVLQYEILLEKVNKAHFEYTLSEFLIGCAKEASKKMCPQVRARVQKILASPAAQKYVKLQTANGESFNILGFSDEQIKSLKGHALSPLEKLECAKHLSETVKRKVKELKNHHQEQIFIGSSLSNLQKKDPSEDRVLMEARKEHQQVLQGIPKQVVQGFYQLKVISENILQLAQVKDKGNSQLVELSYSLLSQKTTFLSTFISKLRLQIDVLMYGDCKYNTALNNYGERMKTLIEDTSYKLSGLESLLNQYEEKQNMGGKYKTLIEEYSKTKKQLAHSRQTLCMFLTDSPALNK